MTIKQTIVSTIMCDHCNIAMDFNPSEPDKHLQYWTLVETRFPADPKQPSRGDHIFHLCGSCTSMYIEFLQTMHLPYDVIDEPAILYKGVGRRLRHL